MAIIEENYVNFTAHPDHLLSNVYQLYLSNAFVDLCLVCQGNEIYAHKAIIAAASPFLRERIKEFGDYHARIHVEHEIHGMDINIDDVRFIIEFIYRGKVHVPETRLSIFLSVGNILQISGLFGQQSELLNDSLTYIPQDSNNCLSIAPLPELISSGFQNIDENSTSHNEFQPDSTSFLFPSILSPQKLSDSSIKPDKIFSNQTSNASFNDLSTTPVSLDSYTLFMDKTLPVNTEDINPKLPCDLNVYDIHPIEVSNTLTTLNTSIITLSENSTEVFQEELDKEGFDDHDSTQPASPLTGDRDIFLGNLSLHQNSYLSPGSLNPSICLNSSLDLSFNTCKSFLSHVNPERQLRLKVKDSIGGVSLQDTSEAEKATLKEQSDNAEKAQTENICPEVTEIHVDIGSSAETCIDIEQLENEEEIHICPQCLKCFSNFDVLTNHLYDDHNIGTMFKCLICDFETLVENNLADHGKKHLEASVKQCCVCSKTFKTKVTLRNHLSSHRTDKLFKCKLCNAHYSQRFNLQKHLASEHRLGADGTPIREQVSCSHCSYVTWAPHKLKNHEIRCHTIDKPYKCSQCPYSSNEKTSLVKHVRIHTQEKPYMCDLCAQSFTTLSSLKRHTRVHSKEKPHECAECGQKFADKKRLRDHHMKHSSLKKPFKCPHCPYTCRRKDNLPSHIKRAHRKVNTEEEVPTSERGEETSPSKSTD